MNAASQAPASATPYLVLGATRKSAAEIRLAKCLTKWRQEWCATACREYTIALAPCADIERLMQAAVCTMVGRAAELPSVYVVATNAGIGAALGIPQTATGDCAGNELAGGVARELTNSLARAVLLEAQYQVAQIDAAEVVTTAVLNQQALSRWWCAVIDTGLTLLISPVVVSLLAPANKHVAAKGLDRRRGAILDETVTLEAVLGEAQVSVGELSSLRVNDVVVLTGALSQPGSLRNSSGRQIASVSLGRVEGKRAVVIMK